MTTKNGQKKGKCKFIDRNNQLCYYHLVTILSQSIFQSERGGNDGNDAYFDYVGMHGVQEQKLRNDEEQEDQGGSPGTEEILPALQKRNLT